jgi:hypothetical protein
LDAERKRESTNSSGFVSLKSSAQDQAEVLALKQQIDKLEGDRRGQIEACQARKARDIDDQLRVNERFAKEYQTRIDQQNVALKELNNEFERLETNPDDELRRVREATAAESAAAVKETERRLKEMKHEHITALERCQKELHEWHNRVQTGPALYQQQFNQDRNEKEGFVESLQRTLSEGITKQKTDWEGHLSMLVERIEVLTAKRDSLQAQYETRDGRQCDFDTIEALTVQLRAVTSFLTGKLKDFGQYKNLMIEQEKVYNAHFGKNPNVGLCQFIPEMRSGPRSARV